MTSKPPTHDDLRRLLAAATPGPWEFNENAKCDTRWVSEAAKGGSLVCDVDETDVPPEQQRHTAALIVAAVNALPGLLDELGCSIEGCKERGAFCAEHADYDLSGTEERDALKESLRTMAQRYSEVSAEVERLRRREIWRCPECGRDLLFHNRMEHVTHCQDGCSYRLDGKPVGAL